MKNLLSIFAIVSLLLVAPLTNAQSNLKFNQVINLKSGENYTVPAGRVLKIESLSLINGYITLPYVGCLQCNGCSYYYCTYQASLFSLGGLTDTIVHTGSSFSSAGQCNCPGATYSQSVTTLPAITFPIWLKEGQQVQLYNGSGLFLSGLEFNVTQ